jgi:hypothetical protein
MGEFINCSKNAARELIDHDMDAASRFLSQLFELFELRMTEEDRKVVLQKTLDLWTIKAVREQRDDFQGMISLWYRYGIAMISLCYRYAIAMVSL